VTWIAARLFAPFRFDGRLHAPLVAAFVAINTIVAVNTVIHHSQIGYDAEHHLAYVRAMANGHLPTPAESAEHYSAPLPYAIAAPLSVLGIERIGVVNKLTQLANIGASLLLTWCVVGLCRRIDPADRALPVWALLLLGSLPVFYRSMAFIRGEALCAALGAAGCLRLLSHDVNARHRAFAVTGAVFGLALLAKQWAAMLVAAALIYLVRGAVLASLRWRPLVSRVAVFGLAATALGGWFFVYLFVNFGTPFVTTADPPRWAINRPLSFYSDINPVDVVMHPIRRDRVADSELRLVPVFYADAWGDYWCYWLLGWDSLEMWAVSPAAHMNEIKPANTRATFEPYLRTLMVAGVLPTVLMCAGLWRGISGVASRRRSRSADAIVLCALAAGVSLLGFAAVVSVFEVMDIKATYLLQFFPFAAILGSVMLSRIRDTSPRLSAIVHASLILILIHNLPAMFSQYSILGGVTDWK
jgi:hypothetical protein